MQKRTVFDIVIDFEKSHGSYVYDKKTHAEFLDLFSMFSSLPLGYNHQIFDESFERKIRSVSKIRMCNNLFLSEEREEFLSAFKKHVFSDYIHLTCTGALAVEAAIKCAMETKKVKNPMVLALKKSFHGINSWGFITDRHSVTAERMKNFPANNWLNLDVGELKKYLATQDASNLVALVVEPIQCTAGDIYINSQDLKELQELCNRLDVCFIVDEIQTGFGVTGKMWYSDRIGLKPDVLVFGKKSQVCGIVVSEKYNECLTSPYRKLEVTFDGELIDIVRATYILKAYEKFDLINRAKQNSEKFAALLRDQTLNYRSIGHLIAFDFENRAQRDSFAKKCYAKNLLVNPTGEASVRLRPNLAISDPEFEHFASIAKTVLAN